LVSCTLSAPESAIPPATTHVPASIQTPDKTDSINVQNNRNDETTEPVHLTASPANPDDLAHIFPLGLMSGSHVTPVDHQYYYWNALQVPLERYPVYSPADGYVISVQFLGIVLFPKVEAVLAS